MTVVRTKSVQLKEVIMETWYYVVESLDGDYANLRRTDVEKTAVNSNE